MLRSRFVVAGVFKGHEQTAVWMRLETGSGVDVPHCNTFSHLFPLSEKLAAAKNVANEERSYDRGSPYG